ncbi:WD40 repeat-like protein [Lentinus tigrinus ALCF2SS1-7]|uniref:WD40 repeat-like protein n=1 Tax=Lentinus tigrinus ALCF2SS1-7 TaxID=1328758 RepID=UPI001165E6AD|nr:WD40 repeat-like protein [Lentinus tigrinus ALCF2SS1-7]
MSESVYTQTAHLSGGHSQGITAISFNPEGSLLATASLDGAVCIWSTNTWTLLDVYRAKVAITSLHWFNDNTLVCGLQDGVMSSLVKKEDEITVSGFWAHDYPVEHLAVSGNLVASGAHEELRVWDWNTNAALSCLLRKLPLPTSDGKTTDVVDDEGEDEGDLSDSSETDNDVQTQKCVAGVTHAEVLVTGVGFAQSFLVTTYLHHGIRLFDTQHWKLMKVIDTSGTIVCSSLSPNGGFLAASNLAVGFDVYDLESSKVIRTFSHNPGDYGRAVPVLFIHGGHAILGGSTSGCINVWYVEAAQRLPPMAIPHNQKVLAIAARYDEHTDRFFIATGVMNESSSSSVIIWASASSQDATQEEWEDDSCEDVYSSTAGTIFFHVFMAFGVLAALACAVLMTDMADLLMFGMNVESERFELEYHD